MSSQDQDFVLEEDVFDMLSYFMLFVNVLFPPLILLLIVLLMPLPTRIQKSAISLCDSILFFEIYPGLPLSLFWFIVLLSLGTLVFQIRLVADFYILYKKAKEVGGVKEDPLIKLLAAERNAWISAAALCGWIFVHRYRSLLKKYLLTQEDGKSKVN